MRQKNLIVSHWWLTCEHVMFYVLWNSLYGCQCSLNIDWSDYLYNTQILGSPEVRNWAETAPVIMTMTTFPGAAARPRLQRRPSGLKLQNISCSYRFFLKRCEVAVLSEKLVPYATPVGRKTVSRISSRGRCRGASSWPRRASLIPRICSPI